MKQRAQKYLRGLKQRQKEYDKEVGDVKLHTILNLDHFTPKQVWRLESKIQKILIPYRMRNPHTNKLTENLRYCSLVDTKHKDI